MLTAAVSRGRCRFDGVESGGVGHGGRLRGVGHRRGRVQRQGVGRGRARSGITLRRIVFVRCEVDVRKCARRQWQEESRKSRGTSSLGYGPWNRRHTPAEATPVLAPRHRQVEGFTRDTGSRPAESPRGCGIHGPPPTRPSGRTVAAAGNARRMDGVGPAGVNSESIRACRVCCTSQIRGIRPWQRRAPRRRGLGRQNDRLDNLQESFWRWSRRTTLRNECPAGSARMLPHQPPMRCVSMGCVGVLVWVSVAGLAGVGCSASSGGSNLQAMVSGPQGQEVDALLRQSGPAQQSIPATLAGITQWSVYSDSRGIAMIGVDAGGKTHAGCAFALPVNEPDGQVLGAIDPGDTMDNARVVGSAMMADIERGGAEQRRSGLCSACARHGGACRTFSPY